MAKHIPYELKSHEWLKFSLFDLTEEQLEQLEKDAKNARLYVGGVERCKRVDELVKQLKVLHALAPEQFKDLYIEVGETVEEFRYGRISVADFLEHVETEENGVTDLAFYQFMDLDNYDYGDSSNEYIIVHSKNGSEEYSDIIKTIKDMDVCLSTEVCWQAYDEYTGKKNK